MKILLLEHPRIIHPGRCNDIANTPLSSCLLSGYVAAILQRRGHEVAIVEGFLDNLSYPEIKDKVRAMRPDVVGVHIVYHWKGDDELFRFLDRIKKEFSPAIAAYGYYPSNSYDQVLHDCRSIDTVILGEPDQSFVSWAEAIMGGGAPDKVNGTAIRETSGAISVRRGSLIENLDSLPFPVRTDALYRIGEVNILGSRGCYGSCTFCHINPFYGHGPRWRGRSPENIIAEIDGIIADTGYKRFYFTDPNFFGPGRQGQDRAFRLSSLLKSRHIEFGIEGRVNDIEETTIGALFDAGMRHILIGLESGIDDSLRRMHKMTTVQQNERALMILRRHGIEPNVGFIMFEPLSSLHDVRTNFEFLKRNDLLKNLPVTANVLCHHQIILKGMPAYDEPESGTALESASTALYEKSASFADDGVTLLALVMRDSTNFLFNRLSDVWSGRVAGSSDARQRDASVNRLLVAAFEDILSRLESGERPDENEREVIVKNMVKEMDRVLGGSEIVSQNRVFNNHRLL